MEPIRVAGCTGVEAARVRRPKAADRRSRTMKGVMSALGLAAILSLLAAGTVLAWPDDTTAALSSTPTGLSAGQSWTVDVTFVSAGHVLRVDTLQPRITIRETTTGETRSFPATVTTT